MTGAATGPSPVEDLATSFAPQAVVLDVDGTLIDAELRLHPRTEAAVRAAAARLPVVLATGRMYRSVLPWARRLAVTQPLVCYQGALVREIEGAVLLDEGLEPRAAIRAIDVAREHGWHRQAYLDDELFCEEDRPEAHVYARIARVDIHFVDDLAALVGRGSTKVVVVDRDPAIVDVAVGELRRRLGPSARITQSFDQFCEVVSPHVNKARAVELVCARLGLGIADALAVGDAPNDAEMLAAAGVGVVVRGARAEVLAAADATCAPPAEGGVADVLEHFGLVG